MEKISKFKKNNTLNYDMNFFIKKILNKEYFSYSRFNDGELICSVKQFNDLQIKSNKNCDNHEYFPKMGQELLNTLNKSNCENYFIQFMSSSLLDKNFNQLIEKLIDNDLLKGTYQYSDFLQQTLRTNPKNFKLFIKTINEKKIIIIGPRYLKNIDFIKYDFFIEVPTINCYKNQDQIICEIEKNLDEDFILLFSSSMATNTIIDKLHNEYGNKNFLLDVGSLWDIFFYKTNPEIKQRSVNLNMLTDIKKWYMEYFK
jgi:hypothetical protein